MAPTRRASTDRSHRCWRTGCEGRIGCAKRDFGLNAHASTGSPAHEPGAATACSPTTSSRSAGSSNRNAQAHRTPLQHARGRWRPVRTEQRAATFGVASCRSRRRTAPTQNSPALSHDVPPHGQCTTPRASETMASVMQIRTILSAEERPSPTNPALHRARASRSACSPRAASGLRPTRRTSTARRRTACSDKSGRRGRTRRSRRRRVGRNRRGRAREGFATAPGDRRRSARARHDDRPSHLNDAGCYRSQPRTGKATTAAPPAVDGEWWAAATCTAGPSDKARPKLLCQ
jgi:hypothetical protein